MMARTFDMTGVLPDEMVEQIASFLMTKEAVQKSLISKRWSKLWTRLSHLNFDEVDFNVGNKEQRYKKFRTFGDNVFSGLQLSKIDSFHMRLIEYESFNLVGRWMTICKNFNPRVLSIVVPKAFSYYLGYYLNCQSVEDLTIDIEELGIGYFSLHNAVINLPRIRKLYLSYTLLDKISITSLFSGCPVLEDLTLAHCNGKLSSIFNQRLSSLSLLDCFLKLVDVIPESVNLPFIRRLNLRSGYVDEESIHKVLIGSPLLENLLLENCHGEFSTDFRRNLKFVSLKNFAFVKNKDCEDYWKIERAIIRTNILKTKSTIFIEGTFHSSKFDAYYVQFPSCPSLLKIIGNTSKEFALDSSNVYGLSILLSSVEILDFCAPEDKIDVKKELQKIGCFSNLKKLSIKLADWSIEPEWYDNPYESDIVRWFLHNSPNLEELTLYNPNHHVKKYKGKNFPENRYYSSLQQELSLCQKLNKVQINFCKDPFTELKVELCQQMKDLQNIKFVISDVDE